MKTQKEMDNFQSENDKLLEDLLKQAQENQEIIELNVEKELADTEN
jgi:hypothetical protein